MPADIMKPGDKHEKNKYASGKGIDDLALCALAL